ncbi:hypothetical protein B0H17DRAFT_1339036 [Mycena rosella]|uniref:Uncharacterized protein n=1 Tax=Mycena rosella TaxID=1033263 RepID=A0AAD7CD02_MYCRO|nr:hypothetical protein B0H17DRAFT_1339036 [Mycena rosella]
MFPARFYKPAVDSAIELIRSPHLHPAFKAPAPPKARPALPRRLTTATHTLSSLPFVFLHVSPPPLPAASRRVPPPLPAARRRRFPPHAAAASRRTPPPPPVAHAAATYGTQGSALTYPCLPSLHPHPPRPPPPPLPLLLLLPPAPSPFAASCCLRHCFPPSRLPAAASRFPPPAPSCTIRAPGNLLHVPPRFTRTPARRPLLPLPSIPYTRARPCSLRPQSS